MTRTPETPPPEAGGVVAGAGVAGGTTAVRVSDGAGGGPCAGPVPGGRPGGGEARARAAGGGADDGGAAGGGADAGGAAGGAARGGGGPPGGGDAGRPGGGRPAAGRGAPGADGSGPAPPSVPRTSMTTARAPQHDRPGAAFRRRAVLVTEGTPLQVPVGATEAAPDLVVDRRLGHGAHPTTLTDRHLPRPDHPDGGFGKSLTRENARIRGSVDHVAEATEIRGNRYSTSSDESCDPIDTLRHRRRPSTASGGT